MPSAKIAITVPEEIVAGVDDAARRLGESRSAFAKSCKAFRWFSAPRV